MNIKELNERLEKLLEEDKQYILKITDDSNEDAVYEPRYFKDFNKAKTAFLKFIDSLSPEVKREEQMYITVSEIRDGKEKVRLASTGLKQRTDMTN